MGFNNPPRKVLNTLGKGYLWYFDLISNKNVKFPLKKIIVILQFAFSILPKKCLLMYEFRERPYLLSY